MQDFLRRGSSYRLLEAGDVEKDVTFGQPDAIFQAFSVADTNGDGKLDVAAVLVKRSNPQLQSLIVLHGGVSNTLWLMRDVNAEIVSVYARPKEILPLFCTNCDSNRPLRWTGTEYDSGVYFPGERACLAEGEKVFGVPREDSAFLVRVPKQMEFEVIEIGKRDPGHDRWFHVHAAAAAGSSPIDGWIRTSQDWESGDCS